MSSHIGSAPDYWNNDYFDDTYWHNGRREKYSGYTTDGGHLNETGSALVADAFLRLIAHLAAGECAPVALLSVLKHPLCAGGMARGDWLRGKRVLELGAGTGMPGIVAASLGAEPSSVSDGAPS